MATLHIEHAVVDFDLWKEAFDRFGTVRQEAGVLEHRILRPVDDSRYVMIQLDFATRDRAEGFLTFLTARVWSAPENSPALVGLPRTRILEAE